MGARMVPCTTDPSRGRAECEPQPETALCPVSSVVVIVAADLKNESA
jgi:hypothetical protein